MVRRQTRLTLETLDSPPVEVTMLSAEAVRTRLRAAVLAVDVSQQGRHPTIDDGAASLRVPVDVVDVLESAAGEVLRNSIISRARAPTVRWHCTSPPRASRSPSSTTAAASIRRVFRRIDSVRR